MEDIALQWGPTAALTATCGYFLLLILMIRMRGFTGSAERWFAAYLIVSAVWTVAWALASLWGWIRPSIVDLGDSFMVYTAAMLPPMVAILTLHFLPQRGVRELTLIGLGWTAAVIAVERNVLSAFQTETVLNILRLAGWIGFVLSSVVLTVLEYIRLRRPLHRNRVLYWLVALVLVASGEGLHYWRDEAVAELGLPLRLMGAMMMTYALTTYSLPDLKSVGRRAILAFVVALVRVIFYLAAILGAVAVYQFIRQTSLSEDQLLWLTIAEGVGIAVLMALLQVPVQRIIVGATERLLFGPGYDANRALRDYSQSISNILHIERLSTVAIAAIADVLEVERGALLLITERDDGGADARVIPGMGDIPPMNVGFAVDSPVLRTLRDMARPLTQYDIDMLPAFRNMDHKERQWQWALNVEVYVPIHAKRTLIGALVLGAKQAGEPYQAQDLDVLNTLAGQTAVALENARLFEDQRQLNLEISQLNEELTAVNTRLQQLDKAKNDFLNITSHELRTPLTQVRGYADILGEMIGTDDINKPFLLKVTGNIRRATDRLEAIYSAMIDVSAIGVDALQLHFISVPPQVILVQAAAKWQTAIEERRQTLEMRGLEHLPSLSCDQERLTQAFSNLVNNAIKFTPDGGRIEIWGRVVQGTEPVIEIVVADTGIGIDIQDHELIFEKFYRAGSVDLHSTGNTKFKGAGPGLGLSIAKGVIEGHGGRIWVESDGHDEEACPGSRFHVLLPLKSAVSDPGRLANQLRKTRPVTGLSKRLGAPSDSAENGETDAL
jgi:signal transduction histidine kinase